MRYFVFSDQNVIGPTTALEFTSAEGLEARDRRTLEEWVGMVGT